MLKKVYLKAGYLGAKDIKQKEETKKKNVEVFVCLLAMLISKQRRTALIIMSCCVPKLLHLLFASWHRHSEKKETDLGELTCGSALTVQEPGYSQAKFLACQKPSNNGLGTASGPLPISCQFLISQFASWKCGQKQTKILLCTPGFRFLSSHSN